MLFFTRYPSVLMLSLLTITLLTRGSQAQTAFPNSCEGDCWTHDPALIRRESDGLWFRFSTLDLIGIWTSSELSGPWTRLNGSVITGRSIIDLPGNDTLWAPDVAIVDGLYYCFYSVSVSGSQDSSTGYATSTTMEPGSWTDHGEVLRSTNSSLYNAIDANLVGTSDASAPYYLTWGSYWNGIYQSEVTINGSEAIRDTEEAHLAFQPENDQRVNPVEGAFIWPHDEYYYMFLSQGQCCNWDASNPPPAPGVEVAYKINVCRSENVDGPYVDQDGTSCLSGGGTNQLVSHDNIYAPGGQGILHDDELGDVIYYHYLDLDIGWAYDQAQFGWNILEWADGWPSIA
ncbi:glycoside hydrolase family 43 protein [Xylariomycetidae sp. FL2044]|nr:glycoside hydrolase family 43 protein [Xylariomycetidae sp. FL2044]